MRELSKNFYEKMNNKFEDILHENEQILFIKKKGEKELMSMDYSRVLFDCFLEIHKKEVGSRSVSKIESEEFEVVDSNGNGHVAFHIMKDGIKASLTKEQYDRILIDSCGNIYKIDQGTGRAIPADSRAGFAVKLV